MAEENSADSTTASNAETGVTAYDISLLILGIVSIALLFVLTFAPLQPQTQAALGLLENAISLIFLLDFFWRLYRAPSKRTYLKWGWLDFLSGIPFSFFPLARLARIVREIRVLRVTPTGPLRRRLARRRAESSLVFTLLLALLLLGICSVVTLEAEQGAPHSNIHTGQESLWWGIVTMATVGYGDYYPVTGTGRLMGVILMTVGVAIIGVITSYLASVFIRPGREKREPADDPAALQAELGAIKEELASIKQVLQERNQAQGA